MKNFVERKIRKQIDIYRKRKGLNKLKKNYRRATGKVVFVLQTPIHTNIGDHAIAQAQINFINKRFPKCILIEVNQSFLNEFCDEFKKIIRPDDIITLIGGGNMGDQYINEELYRRKVVKTFLDNKIIVFPQTIYFTNTKKGGEQLARTKNVFSKHPDLTLIARESGSFDLMTEVFPANKVLLTPDIVLSMNESKPALKREGILLVLRNDIEKMLTEENKTNIIEASKKHSKKVTLTDMHHKKNIFNKNDRDYVLDFKLGQFKQAELVITDRLHGMILAAITETPCIAFTNYNQKVSGTYDWIKKLNYIKFVDLNADINLEMQKLLTLKEKTEFNSLNLNKQFNKIIF